MKPLARNVILVVFDSLRKDCIGAYGPAPWGPVHTPHFDALARESLMMTRMYPESLPTLPTRRALYTGRRVYPFHNADFHLKGDFVGAPGWGPIPEEQPTLAELLSEAGYRTALVSDVYHMFKPSKNYWRGFDQWTFLRGQEKDPYRSGPRLTQEQLDYWLPRQLQNENTVSFIQQCIMNIHDRTREEDYFAPRVLKAAAEWLEQNQDADRFFLTVESFDPHEPWLVPQHYRRMYLRDDGPEQVKSGYEDTLQLDEVLLQRTRANYYGNVSLCDRWFGHFMESLRVLGLLDDTLVVFTSDHGDYLGAHGLFLKGVAPFEEVYRVPLVLRGPGIEPGTVVDEPVSLVDLGRTLTSLLLGAEHGDAFGGHGRDLSGLLQAAPRDDTGAHRSGTGDAESVGAFAEFHGQRLAYTQRIVWRGRYKYVFNGFDRDELYDLETDPHELTNLAALPEHAGLAREMAAAMWREVRRTGDATLGDAQYGMFRFAPVGPEAEPKRERAPEPEPELTLGSDEH